MVRILGIDPGIKQSGYALLDTSLHSPKPALRLQQNLVKAPSTLISVVTTGSVCTVASHPLEERLLYIFKAFQGIIERYQPEQMAIESVFMNKNARSALVLGHARASVICAAASSNMRFFSYAPSVIKQTITGSGRADKQQVEYMLRNILSYSCSMNADASDALACAYCHVEYSRAGQNLYDVNHDRLDSGKFKS